MFLGVFSMEHACSDPVTQAAVSFVTMYIYSFRGNLSNEKTFHSCGMIRSSGVNKLSCYFMSQAVLQGTKYDVMLKKSV